MGRRCRLLRSFDFVVSASLVAALVLLLGPSAAAQAQPADPLRPELRAWVDEHGPIRVGYFEATPMVNVEDGSVTGGWMVELISLAALKVGVPIEPVYVGTTPAEGVSALIGGTIDILGGAGERPDLVGRAESTTPFSWTPIVFVIGPAGEGVTDVDDLTGATVTAIAGSPIESLLLERFPQMDYVVTEDIRAGIAAVVAGDIVAFLGPLAVVGAELQRTGGTLRPVGKAVSTTEVSAWGLPSSPALEIVQAGRDLITDSELSVIHVRWTGFDLGDPARRSGATWLRPVLLATTGGFLILLFISWVLRRRVAAATRDLRDLSESLERDVRRRTAELALANRDLEDSNAALADFASVAAHDLRGPLAAIRSGTDLIQTGQIVADEATEILDMIGRSAMGMADMIESLLNGARKTVPAVPVASEDLRTWLEDVFGPELQAVGAVMTVAVPAERIDADGAVLKHAAVNLVGNAIKYSVNPEGSEIAVRVEAGSDTYTLTVTDNGPGVPAHLQQTIFERGFQAERDAPGRGIGLAAVREAVESAGGRITVGSGPAGGALFAVTLPRLADLADESQVAPKSGVQRL